MLLPRGIRRRIFAAFGVLLAMLALASVAALRTHEEVYGLLEDVAAADKGIEAALRLSAAVRDQYAHQAHTVILNNRTHLDLYGHSQAGVAKAIAVSREHAGSDAERAMLDEIERTASRLDANFQEEILPRISGPYAALAAPHETALDLVEQIVDLTDGLTARLSARAATAQQRAEEAGREAVWRTVALLGAALAFAAGIGIYIDRSITGPLRNVDAGARQLATGDLSARIPVDRNDELGSLAERFNWMAVELAKRQARLVESEKLAGIGKLAAGVAHEINNPLAVILGYAKLIARSPDSQHADDARVISQEVERCQEIVAGLLDLSRRPRLGHVSVPLALLISEVAERLAGVSEKPIEVRVAGDAEIEADDGKLRQVLGNLLRNAHEAAPGEPIEVAIRMDGDFVRVRVSDRGPGIASGERQRIFEPFFTTKAAGTGLGLAVSAAIVHAHGGSLELMESDGMGATFELALPCRAQKDPRQAA